MPEHRRGLRFGPIHDVVIEIDSDSVDNAQALAAIGKWLPGFMQIAEPDSLVARMLGWAENLKIDASERRRVFPPP